MDRETLYAIAQQFQLEGEVIAVEPFGTGLIHQTYRSTAQHAAGVRWYIHQRLNQAVFRQPLLVLENMQRVTEHIRAKIAAADSNDRKATLCLVPARDGHPYYRDPAGEYWRTTELITDAVTYDTIQFPQHAYEAGKTLGEFQRFVADLPPEALHDTLPGFHDTPQYFQQFRAAVTTPHPNPAIEVRKQEPQAQNLIQQTQARAALADVLMTPWRAGVLPTRIVHNDPKINNILMDPHTQRGLGMIDLDTVKGGLAHFDVGDCLRSAANPAGEETLDIAAVHFDLAIFEGITTGYLHIMRDVLTAAEIQLLPQAIPVIIFEQAVRFLTDYLRGDVYYPHMTYPTQNLQRAAVQMALLNDVERQTSAIQAIFNRLSP